MPDRQNVKTDRLFPVLVSAGLIILTGIFLLLRFRLAARLFISAIDQAALLAFLAILLLLWLGWLFLTGLAGGVLSARYVYTSAKWLLFFVFYPLAISLAWLLRVKKEQAQTSFLLFQNRLFLHGVKLDASPRLLLLLPHCLQFHDCRIRITRDINDCEQCGKCSIGELKKLGQDYQIAVGIANGGTLARKIVHDANPDVIIAVACHRDLTDGVRESWKYPVYAILNERPHGPCFDTQVNTDIISDLLQNLIRR